MARYYVNKNAQDNGDHEVHKIPCPTPAAERNRLYLGYFTTCRPAVREARKHYSQVNGCDNCSSVCHTT